MSMRLGLQPGEVIDRGRRFRFTWNGEAYPAYEGDTIVSALAPQASLIPVAWCRSATNRTSGARTGAWSLAWS